MVSDGKLRVDAGQLFRQLVRFFFVFHLGSKKLAYGRFKNDGNYQFLLETCPYFAELIGEEYAEEEYAE